MIERMSFRDMAFQYDRTQGLFTNVNTDLPVGENVLITGASGTGKSALMKIMAGLLVPNKGSYFINDYDVAKMSFEEFLPIRQCIGYSFDYGGLLANRTLWDNLMLPLQYHGLVSHEEAQERVSELIARFGLEANKDRRPASVSGGLRKATSVARAFVMNPVTLIMDDPFVGLDRDQINNLMDLVEAHRQTKRLKNVFFTLRGESGSAKLATKIMNIENFGLKIDWTPGAGLRKVANQ